MQENILLDKYAKLVVNIGVNLQKDQILVINSPIECADFARRIAAAAFAAKAHDVVISWSDEEFAKLRYLNGEKKIFYEFPEWRRAFYTDYAEQGAAFVSIAAKNPEIFKEVDPEVLTISQQAAGAALLEYRARLMSNKNTWCVVSVPTADWAKKVFAESNEEEAVEKLWQAIFKTVRIEENSDPIKLWEEHAAFLKRAADFLNEHRFTKLKYKNSLGTDLTIELPAGHIWAGGAEYSATGVRFIANMPTEEVYTLPKRDGVNGIVYATKPLNYGGNLIEDFYVRFEKGKVVEHKAKKGDELLTKIFTTDEGASYLGEVALVPYDSPISRSGILFYNTLFDENAACHLAFGKAYPTCIEGGEDMDSMELLEHGVNDSLVHIDFMVGSADLSVTGVTAAGEEIPIMREGNFVF